ncbi:MAG: hypothetical protein AAGI52_03305 [Bacteroidota bacterium]
MVRTRFTPPCGFDIATTTIESARGLAAIAYWGYRAVAHPDGSFFLHETYYDERGDILGIARAEARPCGETIREVREMLDLMRDGLGEPPLRYTDYDSGVPEGAGGDGSRTEPPVVS